VTTPCRSQDKQNPAHRTGGSTAVAGKMMLQPPSSSPGTRDKNGDVANPVPWLAKSEAILPG
jgi:hypothetical protein